MSDDLRYRISRWDQLRECKSNNSKELKICVINCLNNDLLRGTIISVIHARFGCLFSTVINRSGDLVSEAPEMTVSQILDQLLGFGFIVEFPYKDNLPEAQISYLRTLQDLSFDKIRVCTIISESTGKPIQCVTVFKIENLPDWIYSNYNPSYQEYVKATTNGYAFNLNNVNSEQNFNWDWLTYVANIEDIIRDNTH